VHSNGPPKPAAPRYRMGANLCSATLQQGAFSSCTACTTVDAADWIFCLDTHAQVETKRLRKAKDKFAKESLELDPTRLETLTLELFKAHDLNDDGLLQEGELIALNERIAMLHHGKGVVELQEVRETYTRLFRTKLDPMGRPVGYEIFRRYARGVLDELDQDPEAQEMILEQFVAEAWAGRESMAIISQESVEAAESPVQNLLPPPPREVQAPAPSLHDTGAGLRPISPNGGAGVPAAAPSGPPQTDMRYIAPQSSGRTLAETGPRLSGRLYPDGI